MLAMFDEKGRTGNKAFTEKERERRVQVLREL